ncbi:MAG TPA: polymer-forming cytoskeletal protein [Burkholderiaceae bacterium]|nr:polymer-forming cytoskeletal protein [Burkholderiaceae bacterium]HQR78521.1 polymer-forming cytoskeletal protein [Burkholderiaceae bacterium]
MFGTKRATPKTIGTLVGAGTTIEGTLSYVGGLRIDGTVKGDIRSANGEAGMVIISEPGCVIGEVHAAHLVVSGKINGPVYVTDVLELQPKAQVTGDVRYRTLEIHHGAVVEGRLIHDTAEVRPALKLASAATTSEPTGT